MAVRIQLASNFQVVELTYDKWSDVDSNEVQQATEMVNDLGQKVVNDIKTNKPVEKKPEKKAGKKAEDKGEMATEGQIKFLIGLGLTDKEAKAMTKGEAWQYIQDNK